MNVKHPALLFLYLVLGIFCSKTFAQETLARQNERITSFHADIKIDSSGLIHVSEKINVYAAGSRIKRGLIRTIPTFRKDISGDKMQAGFSITSILMDGKHQNYKIETDKESKTIYIGNKDIIIPPGKYQYEINYDIKGQLGRYEKFDEIYWNVTGSKWTFMIEKSSVKITLPQGAVTGNTSCYTGPPGSNAKNCRMNNVSPNTVFFETNDVLQPGEGFTVAVAFNKGIIQKPPLLDIFISDYLKYLITLILLGVVATYYYFSWLRYGKAIKSNVIIPSFNIPNDWSPALIRYLYKKNIDEKSFAISIINMAVKKVIRITNGNSKKVGYAIERLTASTTALSKEELAIYTRFLTKKNRIYINKANGSAINSARNAHIKELKIQVNLKTYFISYRTALLKAIGVTFAVFILFMTFVESRMPMAILISSPFISIGSYFFITGIKALRESFVKGIFPAALGAAIAGWPLMMLINHIAGFPLLSLIFTLISTLLFVIHFFLLKTCTTLGEATMNEIKGFKMYLKTAEEHRLNMLNPPELTPALFERFLPYAIALDVENAWGKKFTSKFSEVDYNAEWYVGNGFSTIALSHAFILPFNSAVSDSKPESGGSSDSSGSSDWGSGSSDSGSSDGGGGGGGGDGW